MSPASGCSGPYLTARASVKQRPSFRGRADIEPQPRRFCLSMSLSFDHMTSSLGALSCRSPSPPTADRLRRTELRWISVRLVLSRSEVRRYIVIYCSTWIRASDMVAPREGSYVSFCVNRSNLDGIRISNARPREFAAWSFCVRASWCVSEIRFIQARRSSTTSDACIRVNRVYKKIIIPLEKLVTPKDWWYNFGVIWMPFFVRKVHFDVCLRLTHILHCCGE